MNAILDRFPPTRAAAQAALAAFVPHAGNDYAQTRNFDFGPKRRSNVSNLSPYIRARVLDEVTVARAVLAQHSPQAADKFLTEVFWRTYWKGWMELRPDVWNQYTYDINRLHYDVQTQSGLRKRWETACLGDTGIVPFDAWAKELAQTGYLHNHARMWFASIWIFTLELPWQLGADFFMRHLLDGDVASNTLSWRWVAGIQTRGKTYLATRENIETFTEKRFSNVTGLAQRADPQDAPENPAPRLLPPCVPLPLPDRYGVLLHCDDAGLSVLKDQAPEPVAFAYADATAAHSPWQMAPHVADFRARTAADVLGANQTGPALTSATALAAWAKRENLAQVVTLYAPTGPLQQMLSDYAALPDAPPLSLHRRALDTAAWPLATKGFFPFRKHIPRLIGEFVRKSP
ncbi:MAG: FAD-binding domain-containing protein [Sulfitobacter sp.]